MSSILLSFKSSCSIDPNSNAFSENETNIHLGKGCSIIHANPFPAQKGTRGRRRKVPYWFHDTSFRYDKMFEGIGSEETSRVVSGYFKHDQFRTEFYVEPESKWLIQGNTTEQKGVGGLSMMNALVSVFVDSPEWMLLFPEDYSSMSKDASFAWVAIHLPSICALYWNVANDAIHLATRNSGRMLFPNMKYKSYERFLFAWGHFLANSNLQQLEVKDGA